MMSEANWELIVHRLDAIVLGQSDLKLDIKEINKKLAILDTIKQDVDEFKKWKDLVENTMPVTDMKSITEWRDKMDEVISPTQLKEKIDEIDKLKTFKTKATTIWVVVQAIVFLLLFGIEISKAFKP
jgi:hypothetical protein